ncbi:MAG TPA: class I SAM-dependent methyltransferase [Gemmataceae bacterium]|nr:class I SAM-dependent methyltransferase [Gemmataceae bacterium]
MRLLEALSLSSIRKDIRRLLDVANPQKLFRRCLSYQRYLQYCYNERALIHEVEKEQDLVKHTLGNRELVHKVMIDPGYVKTALEWKHYFLGCLCYRSALEPFLYGRHSLEKMNVDEGSLYLEDERELVREVVLQANALEGPIIEVGTLFGYTTSWMAQWKNADKKIVSVDNYCWNPWNVSPDSHRLFTKRILGYLIHRGEVELVDMDKNAFYESYRGPSPSMVFLDANHTYEETRKDIEWAQRIGAKIIAGHDYFKVFGVVRAVDEAGGRCAGASGVWVLNGSDWQQGAGLPLRPAA